MGDPKFTVRETHVGEVRIEHINSHAIYRLSRDDAALLMCQLVLATTAKSISELIDDLKALQEKR